MTNSKLRSLFALPPIKLSTSTELTVPELPAQEVVTGDKEIDAVLWLRKVISTGQQSLIDKAMKAAKLIKTPLKDLETRYLDHVSRTSDGHFGAVMMAFGFADLEGLAKSSKKKLFQQQKAISRFGTVEAMFVDTPAEAACETALKGLKRRGSMLEYDAAGARKRFEKFPELVPHTLLDCIHAQTHGSELYWLRNACNRYADPAPAFQCHQDYCFSMLAEIAPRSKEEALAVYEYLEKEDCMDRTESPAILRNLISGGWLQ